MKIKIFITLLYFLGLLTCFGQQQNDSIKKHKLPEKLHLGGGLNFGISSYSTTIGISPVAMYEVSDKVGVGTGINYMYSKWRNQDVSYNVFGAGVFLQYFSIRQIQLLSEFEYNHIVENYSGDKDTYNVPAMYLGVGYAIGKYGAIGVKYDLLWDEHKSIYSDPLIPYFRIYF